MLVSHLHQTDVSVYLIKMKTASQEHSSSWSFASLSHHVCLNNSHVLKCLEISNLLPFMWSGSNKKKFSSRMKSMPGNFLFTKAALRGRGINTSLSMYTFKSMLFVRQNSSKNIHKSNSFVCVYVLACFFYSFLLINRSLLLIRDLSRLSCSASFLPCCY